MRLRQSDRIRDRKFSEFLGEAKVTNTLSWLAMTGRLVGCSRREALHVPEHRNVVIHDSPARQDSSFGVLITVFSPLYKAL
jgi:hypothetical protein